MIIPMLRILLANRIRATAAALRGGGWAQAAVVAAFLAIGAAIFVGAYFAFLHAFGFLLAEAFAGPLLARYVLEAAFAIVFFLGIASFVASSSFFFYRSDELAFLSAMPIPSTTLFVYRFIAATAASSWPVILLAVPALAAFCVASGGGAAQVALAALIAVLFTLAIALTGGILSFLVAPLTRKLPVFGVWVAEAAAFLLAAAWLGKRIVPRSILAVFERATDAAGAAESERRLSAMFAWFPSSPFVRMLTDAASGAGPSAVRQLFVISCVLALAAYVLFSLARRAYLPLWQSYGDRTFVARPLANGARPARRIPFPRFFRLGYGFLLEKDLLMLVRDGGEMARAAFLGAILALFVASLRAIAGVDALGSPQLFTFAVTFAFASICYLTLTFCMRFVFPAFSLEGRGAWAVLSSPIHAHELFSWKYFFWAAIMLCLSLPATVATAAIFGLPSALGSFLMLAMTCVAFTVVALTLGQGTLFPRFRELNPDVIATSPAGLAATGLGLAYLLVVSRYVHAAVSGYLATGAVANRDSFGILIISIALAGTYWIVVVRELDRMEIAP